MLGQIINAVSYAPQVYQATKAAIINYGTDDSEKIKILMNNLLPSSFMFVIASMAIASDGARPRLNHFSTLMIDDNNDIRNERNGDTNYIFASRNLINSWYRILIISLTIFPPVPLRSPENIPHIILPKIEPSLALITTGTVNASNQETVSLKPSVENNPDQTFPKIEGENPNTALVKPNLEISTDHSQPKIEAEEKLNAKKPKQSDSHSALINSKKITPATLDSRIVICEYMIKGIKKTIRSYAKDLSAEPTRELLKTHITLIQNALNGERLPPIPGKAVPKSVNKYIRNTCPETLFDKIAGHLIAGDQAAQADGFACSKTLLEREKIQKIADDNGKEFGLFMSERSVL